MNQQTTGRKSTVSFQEEEIIQDTPVLEGRRMSILAKAKRRVSLVFKRSPQNATPDNDQQEQKITPRSDCSSNNVNYDVDSFYSNGGSTASSASSLSNSFSSPRHHAPRPSFASLFPSFTCPSGAKQLEVSSDFDKMKHERMLRAKYFEDQLEFKKVRSIPNLTRDNFKNKLKSRMSSFTQIEQPTTILKQKTNKTNFETLIHRNVRKWNWNFYVEIQKLE